MSEFTPGKWKAFDGEKFHVIRQAHADDVEGHDYGNGKLIAHVVQWHEGHDWANACLIAAAPEMHHLLRCFMAIDDLKSESFTDDNHPLYMRALVEQDAAVKATRTLLASIDNTEVKE